LTAASWPDEILNGETNLNCMPYALGTSRSMHKKRLRTYYTFFGKSVFCACLIGGKESIFLILFTIAMLRL
jgi:hypothetical protein